VRVRIFGVVLLLASVGLTACGGGGDDDNGPDPSDFYITAKVDGVDYAGNSKGAALARLASEDSGELNLFPADALSGTIIDWSAGQTGSFDLASGAPPEAILVYVDGTTGAHASTSGTFAIDTWEWDNDIAPKLGYMTGTFQATCSTLDQTSTVAITDGAFYIMVTEVVGQ
jgi:hypothetical protein